MSDKYPCGLTACLLSPLQMVDNGHGGIFTAIIKHKWEKEKLHKFSNPQIIPKHWGSRLNHHFNKRNRDLFQHNEKK